MYFPRHARVWTAFALLFAMACIVAPAAAQVSASSYGGNQTFAVGGMASGFHLDYGKRYLGGAGVYVDGDLNDHWGLEGEANWLWLHQFADTHFSTYMGGPRYNFNTRGNFRPYVKALGGGALFNFPYNYARGSYFVVAGGGGLDYHIAPRLRLRVADFEYQYWPEFSFGAIKPYGVSVGIQYQLFGCDSCRPHQLGK
jgi:Outer membrane protein beta-barrel domain